MKEVRAATIALLPISPQRWNLPWIDDRDKLPIDSINRIEFAGEDVYVEVEGQPEIKIRGGESNAQRREVWRDVPLEAFRIDESGWGEVDLAAAIMNELRRLDIRDIARRETYVVDEIEFDGSETMTLKMIIGTF